MRGRASGDSLLWLAAVAVLFAVAELVLTPLRMPLGWDEITYIAQTSTHASPILLPPGHSRGAGLLAAPVTLVTTSVVALRIWMSLLSAAGLFLAFLAWRGLRPAWVLALAALLLGSLAVSQLYGPQVMADWWEALGLIAVTGIYLQADARRLPATVTFPLLTAGSFFLILLRVEDAAFILAPLAVFAGFRNRPALFAIITGSILGAIEWVAEANAWYGGPAHRLHLAAQQPPKFGFYFSLPYQLQVLNGPNICDPHACHGWDFPWLTIWWALLLLLAVAGFLAVRGITVIVSAVTGLSVLAGYTLFVPYAAPRYLLPFVAVVCLLAADGCAWLLRSPTSAVAVAAVGVFVVAGAVAQHLALRRETALYQLSGDAWVAEAAHLRAEGVRPPCVIRGVTPVAYYLGCRTTSGAG